MFKNQLNVIVLTLILSLLLSSVAQSADPDLAGWWKLDESQGTVAHDTSGHDNHGTLTGNPTWQPIEGVGGAISFSSDGQGRVVIPSIDVGTRFTVMAWINPDDGNQNWGRVLISRYQTGFYLGTQASSGTWMFIVNGNRNLWGGTAVSGQWQHVAGVFDGTSAKLYVNGQLVAGPIDMVVPSVPDQEITIGLEAGNTNDESMRGLIDDARIYTNALDDATLALAMQRSSDLAANPQPANAATDVLRDVILDWASGDTAEKHNVYLGTVFDDVYNAGLESDLLVSKDQVDITYDAGILAFGQTYYWRVDEVEGAPDYKVFKGDVWRFTVEPYSIPIEGIIATASSSNFYSLPEKTIDGSGLNDQDQHSLDPRDMWISGEGDQAVWIQYEFDKPYKLHEMWVWNSNQLTEAFTGLGVKKVTIETSMDGVEWTALDDGLQFNQAPGIESYTPNTKVDFSGTLAKFVNISINSGWGPLGQYSLSEVRFMTIPTYARELVPEDGSITESVDVELRWRAGREAAGHQVYLGTDPDALTLMDITDEPKLTAEALNYATTYYWSVTEVNETEAVAAYTGDIVSFTTPDYGVIDGFESYTDVDGERIYQTWHDGWDNDDNGSQVGYEFPPFAEGTVVHSGEWSMPLQYEGIISEATLSFDTLNWTAGGIQSLSLVFYGTEGNTGQLYVKINNTKVAYPGDTSDIARAKWQAWVIELADVVVDLQQVTSLTIGIEGANAKGLLYIDDIGLYPKETEYITPTDPGNVNLMGHWDLDEDSGDIATDTSGNENHGTLDGSLTWQPSEGINGALRFFNTKDRVVIPSMDVGDRFTVMAWVKPDDGNQAWARVLISRYQTGFYLGTQNTTGTWMFIVNRNFNLAGGTALSDQWQHVAGVYDGTSATLYVNGMPVGAPIDMAPPSIPDQEVTIGVERTDSGDQSMFGLIDDVRIYKQALSHKEILWLAGETEPIVAPF